MPRSRSRSFESITRSTRTGVLPENAALAEHGVHQRGFAVVHVGDDGDIANGSHNFWMLFSIDYGFSFDHGFGFGDSLVLADAIAQTPTLSMSRAGNIFGSKRAAREKYGPKQDSERVYKCIRATKNTTKG